MVGNFQPLPGAAAIVSHPYAGKPSTRAMPAWTSRDEERLKEIQAEASMLVERRATARERVVAAMRGCFDPDGKLNIDSLIRNADVVRDVLEPFDDGVREGP